MHIKIIRMSNCKLILKYNLKAFYKQALKVVIKYKM